MEKAHAKRLLLFPDSSFVGVEFPGFVGSVTSVDGGVAGGSVGALVVDDVSPGVTGLVCLFNSSISLLSSEFIAAKKLTKQQKINLFRIL